MARFLVADGDPLGRTLLRDILVHRGHQVIEASGLVEAQDAVHRETLDVILVDMHLRPGGGESLLRSVQSDSHQARTPVVALTSQATRSDRERLLSMGFQSYVAKPVDTRRIGETLESLVVGRQFSVGAKPNTEGRVLVVDDQEPNRKLLRASLELAGYTVGVASSGLEALEILKTIEYDLVLLDIQMPEVDGWEVCAQLRLDPRTAHVPIVFLTAFSDLETHRRALNSGADDFLSKPVSRTELLLRIRSLMRSRQMTRELTGAAALIRSQHETLLQTQRQRDDLTALVVHDLKNPIAGILTNVRFLLSEPDVTEDARECLEDVVSMGETMHRMVLNLLDISRSENGVLTPRLEFFDITELLQELCRQMQKRAGERHQTLIEAVGLVGRRINADRDMLRRVFENLIENSLKYSSEGATVRVEASFNASFLEVRVMDEGPGVPPSMRDKVFEKFVQVDPNLAPHSRSSRGLGLAFCRLAVLAHGGRIWVEDRHPIGASFCVALPG